jgi:hypothetical protein
MKLPQDSPVEQERKSDPCGNGNWPGFESVWDRIQIGCHKMARAKYMYLSQDHVESMADLGSGHEERMKARLHWMYTYGWI